MKNKETPTAKAGTKELPIILFENQDAWTTWLAKNHEGEPGIWLRLAKKASGIDSVSYEQAVETALCYGWIDGQSKRYDDETWLQKFTPRGPRSIWSKINRDKVTVLINDGRMEPAGMAAIERAKQKGQWDAAYDSARNMTVPDDFQAALDTNKKAAEFFANLNSTNRYAMLFRIQTAKKAETRARRIEKFIQMLERHEKLYP